jgi:Flp pilus assembly protein TadB
VIAAVFLCALGFGLGVVGVVHSILAPRNETPSPTGSRRNLRASTVRSSLLAGVGGLAAALVTGWPVAFVLVAVAIYGLPRLFGQSAASVSVAKIEAIANWTEMLQGTLAASAGLNQAIMATAPLAPLAIREQTLALSGRLGAGMHPRDALLLYGDELGDPCADRVICSLILAVTSRAQRLGDLLAALADSTREEVALRLRVETSRSSIRSGVRTVVVFSVLFAAALAVLAHTYLAPFGTPTGQLVLALVGILYAGGLTLMVVMSRPPAPVRLLGSEVVEQ